MTTVYLVGPIQGMSYKAATEWRLYAEDKLRSAGFDVISPMFAKEYLAKQHGLLKSSYEHRPLSTTHAIFARDYWSVRTCNILLVNFMKLNKVTIGSLFEIAWGWLLGKFIVVAMKPKGPMDHPFVMEAASVVVPSLDEAIEIVIRSKPHEGRTRQY